jgi:hypothetical protein
MLAEEDEASLSSGTLTKDAATSQLTELFGEPTVLELASADWKVRLAAMEKIATFASDPANAQRHCSTLAQGACFVCVCE